VCDHEDWRLAGVFERYAIVSQADIAEALGRPELRNGKVLGIAKLPKKKTPKHPLLDKRIS
jgi:hypothetical protein